MKKLTFLVALSVCLVLCACGAKPTGADLHGSASMPAQSGQTQPQSSTYAQPASSQAQTSADNAADKTDFFQEVKKILSGQDSWSPDFLDAVDFSAAYKSYVGNGGASEDAEAFAAYLTEHAPVPENWKTLFEKDLLNAYSQTPDHYEDLGNGIFQVYVKLDGKVVPYVTVNSRTGWYHG